MLLCGVFSAKADAPSDWNYVGDNYSGTEHVVMVGLTSPSITSIQNACKDGAEVWLGAFMDGECRGVAKMVNQSISEYQDDIWYFPMRIKGTEADNGRQISFNLYYTDIEYKNLKSSTETLEYSNETTSNNLSSLYELDLVEVASFSFPSTINIAVGDSINLLSLLEIAPFNATTPVVKWDFANSSSYIKVENDVLYGLAPNKGTYLGMRIGDLQNENSGYGNAAIVNVMQYVTDLELKSEYRDEQEVYVGDTQALTEILNNCYTVLPANTNEDLTWSCEDELAVTTSQDDNGAISYTPAKAGHYAMALTTEKGYSIGIKLYIKNRVTDFTAALDTIHLFVGDDLATLLPYSYKVQPTEYVDKGYTYQIIQNSTILSEDQEAGTIIAAAEGSADVILSSKDNVQMSASFTVVVHPNVTGVTTNENILNYECPATDVDITDDILSNIVFYPDSTYKAVEGELESGNPEICTSAYDVDSRTWTFTLKPQIGEANINIYHEAQHTVLQEGSLVTINENISSEFVVNVVQGLTGFTFSDIETYIGNVDKLALIPVPSTANVDASKITFEIEDGAEGWDLANIQISSPSYAFDWLVYPEAIGKGTVRVYYDGKLMGSGNISVYNSTSYKVGWSWITPYGCNVSNETLLNYYYGVQELRSQTQLLVKDPHYGFFGDLNSLEVKKGYKIYIPTNSNVGYYDDEVTYSASAGHRLIYNPKWNWIGFPYQFSHPLSDIFQAGDFTKGDRIVSKDSGFAEYNGEAWEGSLTTIVPGEGYLFYNAQSADLIVSLFAEAILGKPTDQGNNVVAKRNSVWSYDDSKYADNMSIIADLGGEFNTDRYSVGAFIDGECRGEGVAVNGKWFITVHGDGTSSGKAVSFRLYDNVTGETYDIKSTQPYTAMAGTLSAPVMLQAPSAVDDILYDNDGAISDTAKYYTVDGVEVTNPSAGLYIVVDGNSARKVYIK